MRELIEEFYTQAAELSESQKHSDAVFSVLAKIDSGELRVCTKNEVGKWETHDWVKKAILLSFRLLKMQNWELNPFSYHDKVELKKSSELPGVRIVPGSIVRKGSYISKNCVLMPSFVNVGAFVGEGTMVDTWATVGSCAQVGSNVHLSGGVGIGGVLEPPQASPVIIEDNCFLGSRAIVVEGVHVEEGAVLGANVVITKSSPIIDVTGEQEVVYKGRVPANSVVIPGTRKKTFPAGEYSLPCALIIGKRKESTDKKTSLNSVLRDFNLPV